MTAIFAIGIIVAIGFDVFVPLVFALFLYRRTIREPQGVRTQRKFWFWTVPYLAWITFWVILALSRYASPEGTSTVFATVFALPFSVIPAAFNSTFINYFFTTVEWSSFGYYIVLGGYLVGLVLWASLGPLALWRNIVVGRRVTAPPPPAP